MNYCSVLAAEVKAVYRKRALSWIDSLADRAAAAGETAAAPCARGCASLARKLRLCCSWPRWLSARLRMLRGWRRCCRRRRRARSCRSRRRPAAVRREAPQTQQQRRQPRLRHLPPQAAGLAQRRRRRSRPRRGWRARCASAQQRASRGYRWRRPAWRSRYRRQRRTGAAAPRPRNADAARPSC